MSGPGLPHETRSNPAGSTDATGWSPPNIQFLEDWDEEVISQQSTIVVGANDESRGS